ncbi:MAG: hypothetical protein AAF636_20370 [Pseudomonadota bacterium]
MQDIVYTSRLADLSIGLFTFVTNWQIDLGANIVHPVETELGFAPKLCTPKPRTDGNGTNEPEGEITSPFLIG